MYPPVLGPGDAQELVNDPLHTSFVVIETGFGDFGDILQSVERVVELEEVDYLEYLNVSESSSDDDDDDAATPRLKKSAAPRFQFDPADNIKDKVLQRKVRARFNSEPCFAAILEAWQARGGVDDIFAALWPYYRGDDVIRAVTPKRERRLILGVVGLLAQLATLSPRVLALLARAPSRPNLEFHMVNALFSVIKCTVKPVGTGGPKDVHAAVHLLAETLKRVAALAENVPDVGRAEYSKSPFPVLDVFLRSFIDRMACTPRLEGAFFCSAGPSRDDDDAHRFGFRAYGDLTDALRVAPDEENTLDEIIRQFEDEFLHPTEDGSAPAQCNLQHPYDQRHHSYGERGPPPLLFFEAIARTGIPRACVVPHVILTACTLQGVRTEYVYQLVTVVSVIGDEDDLALEIYSNPDEQECEGDPRDAIAFVIYKRHDDVKPTSVLLSAAELVEEEEDGATILANLHDVGNDDDVVDSMDG